MKQEEYLIKAKRIRALRTAISVLLCMVFIPLIAINGILLAKGAQIQQKNAGLVSAGTVTVQTQAATTKPATTKPATTKPATTKPATTKPATTKPATTKPATTKPATTKPATTKPATTKPATTKPATTKPATTKPATTKPATTKPATTKPATTKPATPSNTPCIRLADDEQLMLSLINQERTKAGLPKLKLDTKLSTVAQAKSKDMIQMDYFAHQSPVYGSPFDMMTYFGISYTKAGENLAMNTSVERAHIALMSSDSHRKAILSPDYTHVGIGAFQGVSGKYYTQMFVCH